MKKINTVTPLNQDDLHKLHIVLLDLMSEVDRICRIHHIDYMMVGGTLLGAVRHGGFIPWDDDADLGMSRNDYERFRYICQTELNHNKFFLQDNTLDPYYRWGYARLRRKNSEFIRIGQEHMKMKTGIFIDIYPHDNVPDYYFFRVIHAISCFFIRKTLYAQTGIVTGTTVIKRLAYRLLNLIPPTFVFRQLDNLAKRYNGRKTKLVRTLTFPIPRGGRFGFPAEWFVETIDMTFENKTFRTMREYDEYLKFKYGDYMTLPAENKRHWHPASVMRLPND